MNAGAWCNPGVLMRACPDVPAHVTRW